MLATLERLHGFAIVVGWLLVVVRFAQPGGGGVIGDLFRMLHAVRHGTEALVHSDHPREAATSTCLVIIFVYIGSDVPLLFCSAAVLMQLLYRCRH